MTGISRDTAQVIEFDAHLAQSIGDILTTPIGSRVMRRSYGSDLPNLIDAPLNGETLLDIYMATAEALDIWEPRLELTRVQIAAAAAGQIELDLEGDVDRSTSRLSVLVGGTS